MKLTRWAGAARPWVLFWVLGAALTAATARAEVLPKGDPRVERAQEILDRLLQVAAESEVRLIVESTDEPRSPTAGSRRTITLPSSLFGFCYGEDESRWKDGWWPFGRRKWRAGDHCLAFVLAHELTHIRDDDTGERRLAPDSRARRSVEQVNEKRADEGGARLMWTAGFDPFELFEPYLEDEEFFARYSRYLGRIGPDGRLEARGKALRRYVRRVTALLPYFHWGTRMLQLGRYEEAHAWLGRFQGVEGGTGFPAREVLSNRAAAVYQLLARELAACEGRLVARFDLPLVIDPETLASRRRHRGGEPGDHCFERPTLRDRVEEAQALLERAVDQDPTYRPARLNLLSLHLLWRDDPWDALATLEDAKTESASDPLWINASALAHYLLGVHGDTVNRALIEKEVLAPLRRGIEAFPEAHYLRRNLRQIRLELGEPVDPLPPNPTARRSPSPSAPAHLRLGRPAPASRYRHLSLESARSSAPKAIASWRPRNRGRTPEQTLSLNGKIVIAEQWVLGKPPAAAWRTTYGPPTRTVPLARGGELRLHDGWAYQVENDAVVAQLWFDFD